MKTLAPTEHYWRLAVREHGQPQGEVHYSMGYRWKEYGAHPLCASCARSCKVAGADGLLGFKCMDYEKKRAGG